MKSFARGVIFIGILLCACLWVPRVTAACTGLPGIGSIELNALTCTIASVDGVDNAGGNELSIVNTGMLTLTGGSSLTINATGRLAIGSLVLTDGSIALETGAQILMNTPLFAGDEDVDGWPVDFTLYSATSSGRRRFGLMHSPTLTDCNDAVFSEGNICL